MPFTKSFIKGKDRNWFLPTGMRALMEASQIGLKPRFTGKTVEIATTKKEMNNWEVNGGWTIKIAEVEVDVEKELDEVHEKVSVASKKYMAAVNSLRGEMKNDIASISSSATKTLSELSKLHSAFAAMTSLMSGENMKQSIENAERLAAALKAISDLQSHSITFAVLDRKPKE